MTDWMISRNDKRLRKPCTVRLWASLVSSGLMLVVLAGCHSSTTSEPSTQAGAKDAAAAPPMPGADASKSSEVVASNATASDASNTKPLNPNFTPPTLVRRDKQIVQFADKTPQATWEVKIYSDGSKVKDGPYHEFYPDGNKFVEGKYANGKQEGEWKFWADNGKLNKAQTYHVGKLDGSWTLYHDDGNKERDESYKAGVRDGKWTFYGAKNQPIQQEEYKNGVSDGTWIKWYANGKEHWVEHYVDGQLNGPQELWYPNGKPQEKGTLKNGVPDGKRTRWKLNGEVDEETMFDNGHPVTSGSPDK
jgi:antitoxin component YwqK of YwqJK toxin-antitoxin module